MKYSFAFFLLLHISLWAQSGPNLPDLIFTNVNVVDTLEGHIESNRTVVIHNGVIVGVAGVGLIGQTRNMRVINASGKYLIPGLWDMHVHSAFISPMWDEKIIYPLYIANGITGVRDMGGDAAVLLDRRKRIESGELLGPHLFIAGPFLADDRPDAQTIPVKTPEDARAAVDKLKADGVDFIKILSRLSRESYFAIAKQAKHDNLKFAGHVPDTISAKEASEAGQYSIEHLTGISLACSSQEDGLRQKIQATTAARDWAGYRAAGQQVVSTYDPRKADALFSTLVNKDTWQVPTLIWTQTQASLDSDSWDSDPRLKYVPASIRRQWDRKQLLAGTPPQLLADYKQDAVRNPQLVSSMQKARVRFLAGSDGPDPYVFPGFSLLDELELLVGSGLTPIEALQAATIGPAFFMQKLGKYGVVEKNHVADLVLLDDDPIADIRNTRKIAGVVLGGKYYPREELDKMLLQVEDLAKKQ